MTHQDPHPKTPATQLTWYNMWSTNKYDNMNSSEYVYYATSASDKCTVSLTRCCSAWQHKHGDATKRNRFHHFSLISVIHSLSCLNSIQFNSIIAICHFHWSDRSSWAKANAKQGKVVVMSWIQSSNGVGGKFPSPNDGQTRLFEQNIVWNLSIVRNVNFVSRGMPSLTRKKSDRPARWYGAALEMAPHCTRESVKFVANHDEWWIGVWMNHRPTTYY